MEMVKQRFEDVDDLLAATEECYGVRPNKYVGLPAGIGDRKCNEWIGREAGDYLDLAAKARLEWADGLEILQGMLDELGQVEMPPVRVLRRRKCYHPDSGDDVDVDRLRSGQDYWQAMSRQQVAGSPIVCLVLNLATFGGMDSQDVMWRGLAAIVLANVLEQAGYRVEVWAASYNSKAHDDGSPNFVAVKAKAASQPLDLATLVNVVSGWFYRGVIFQSYHIPRQALNSRTPGTMTANMPEVLELAGGCRHFVIDGVWDRSAALAKVNQVVAALQG